MSGQEREGEVDAMALDPVIGSAKVDVYGDFSRLDKQTDDALKRFNKTLDTRLNEALAPVQQRLAERLDLTEAGTAAGASLKEGLDKSLGDETDLTQQGKRAGRAIRKGVESEARELDTTIEVGVDRNSLAQIRAEMVTFSQTLRRLLDTIDVRPAKQKIFDTADLAAEGRAAGRVIRKSVETETKDMRATVEVDVDRDPFRAALTETQREFFDFSRSLNTALDRIDILPSWRRVFARLGDDRGAVELPARQAGERAGRSASKGFSDSVGRGLLNLRLGTGFMALVGKGILGAGAIRAVIPAIGGLVGQLTPILTGLTGLVSTTVGGISEAFAGLATTIGTTVYGSFAGLYATAITSLGAIMPAIKGLEFAFKGMEKAEKEALDKRLKEATKNLQQFGKAVRAGLMPAVFDALKQLDKLVPTLKKFGTELGATAGGLLRDFTKMATSADMIEEIDKLLSNSVKYFKQVGEAGIGLARVLLPAFNSIQPVTQKFFDTITEGIEFLTVKIATLTATDSFEKVLGTWFDRGVKLVKVLGSVGGSILQVLNTAADARGDDFIASLEKMADSFGRFIDKVTTGGRDSTLSKTFAEWYDRGVDLAGAFGNLAKIVVLFFDSAAKAGGDFLGDFRRVTEQWLAEFTRFRDAGGLQDVLKEWFAQGKQVISILGNLGRALLNVFGQAYAANEDFLTSFDRLTEKWADWTAGIGQSKIRAYFEEAKPVIEEVWGLLGDIVGLFSGSFTGDTGNLTAFIQTIRREWIPAIEDMQRIIRESGIQESLYDLFTAFGRFFEVGGGALNGALSTLALAIEALAKALELLGPVVPIVAAFVGSMKALSVLKWVFMGTGLKKVAEGVTALVTSMSAKVGTAGTAGGLLVGGGGGKGGMLAGLATKANIAFAAIFALSTAVNMLSDATASSVKVDEYTDAIERMGASSTSVADQMLKPWADGAVLDNLDLFGSKIDTIAYRLGGISKAKGLSNTESGVDRWFAGLFTGISDFLGFNVTDNAMAEVEGAFGAISGLVATGDIPRATSELKALTDLLKDRGLDSKFADSIEDAKTALRDVTFDKFSDQIDTFLQGGNVEAARDALQALAAALSAQGYDPTVITQALQGLNAQIDAMEDTKTIEFNGIFTPEARKKLEEDLAALKKVPEYFKNGELTKAGREYKRTLLETFLGADVGQAVQLQLAEIEKIPGAIDAATGKLTEKGLEIFTTTVVPELDLDRLNGVNNALTETTKAKIVEIYANPENYIKGTTDLTSKSMQAVIDLIVSGVPEGQAALDNFIAETQREDNRLDFKVDVITPEKQTVLNKLRNLMPDVFGDAENRGAGVSFPVKPDLSAGSMAMEQWRQQQAGYSVKVPVVADPKAFDPTIIQKWNIPDVPIKTYFVAPETTTARTTVEQSTKDDPFAVYGVMGDVALADARASVKDSTLSRRIDANGRLDPRTFDISGVRTAVRGMKPVEMPWKFAAKPTGNVPNPRVTVSGTSSRDGGTTRSTSNNVTVNNYYPKPERASAGTALSLRQARYAGGII